MAIIFKDNEKAKKNEKMCSITHLLDFTIELMHMYSAPLLEMKE